jgi:hypothetical protein
MLFKEIIAVYSENHAKPINSKYKLTDCYDSRELVHIITMWLNFAYDVFTKE